MPRAKSSATSADAGCELIDTGALLTDPWTGREIKHELPGDRFNKFALMTEGNPLAGGERSCFNQRILHPRHLLLHGLERLPYHRRTHLAGTQVPNFLDLEEIEK